MTKKKYMVEGTKLTRSTDRTYTHAVIVRFDKDILHSDGSLYAPAGDFGIVGFCGRLDLAHKLMNQSQGFYPQKHYEIREVHEVIKKTK